MGKPLILIYVGLRNDQSAWTPEWSNNKYTKNNNEYPLNSSSNSNHAQVCDILLSEMLTRFVNPNFRHLWVITKTCIIFSSYQQGCQSLGLVGTGPPVFGRSLWLWHIWSPRIGSSWQTVSNQFSPRGQMVPKIWSPWTKGPQPIWSTWRNDP